MFDSKDGIPDYNLSCTKTGVDPVHKIHMQGGGNNIVLG